MHAPRWMTLLPLLALAAAYTPAARAAAAGHDADRPAIPDGAVFLRLRTPKRDLYVGESEPIDIQVGAEDEVVASIDNPPRLRGDAFTLNVLTAEPERETTLIDGRPFTLLTWHSVLAAIKAGPLPLIIEAPLTVRIPSNHDRQSNFVDESTGGDAFTDPAFQSMLQSTTEQPMLIANEPMTFDVLALPAEGRPPGFSGAVGTFDVTSDLSGASTSVGEPLMLRLHVKGAGNFDRVASPMLVEVKQWKAYHPKATFKALDNIGYRGEKVFEQPVVPARAGTQRLPELAFSYFDPAKKHYAVARTAPPDVDVLAGAGHVKPAALLLRADHVEESAPTPSLVPPYRQPKVVAVPVLMLLGFTAGWMQLRRRVTA